MRIQAHNAVLNDVMLPHEDMTGTRGLPRVLTVRPGPHSRVAFATDPGGLAVEQYKILRRRLCSQRPSGGVVLVTSPNPGDGKTLTAINCAWSLADQGSDTCLVDFDLRSPGVAATLGFEVEPYGVEEVLAGRHDLDACLRCIDSLPLYVLATKRPMRSPGNLLTASCLAPVFSALRARFKWVLVDFAPVMPMSDVCEAIPSVDGALLVLRVGRTPRAMILPSLEVLGSKAWGVVVNHCHIDGESYYPSYGEAPKSDLGTLKNLFLWR